MASGSPVIVVDELSTRFGQRQIHDRISFSVAPGEVFAIAGPSGTGKSVLLREMVMLQPTSGGTIRLFGEDPRQLRGQALTRLRQRIGVLFQDGALFSGLSVLENVALPLRELKLDLSQRLIEELALLKLLQVGLAPSVAALQPRQLSGGMRKRVGLARAMVLDPELLFLDEPTSGLDPVAAAAFDELILQLTESLALTVVMVSHDMDSLWRIVDRLVLLSDAQALAVGTMAELAASSDPRITRFFGGARGRGARESVWNQKSITS